ncbi:MAG: hypothetical protein KC912_08545 [Proteobacteria bacterium]|nr:hypothetical protein [Pseudomonadota bacterium]
MKRRTLLKLGLATVAIPMTLVACEDAGPVFNDDDFEGDSGLGCNTSTSAEGASDSHSHLLFIPAADLANGLGGTYTSSGGDHDHEVEVTGSDMSILLDNCTVDVTTDTGGHAHTWSLSLPVT